MDASGNAMVVWRQWDGSTYWNIHANRYDAQAGTWGGVVLLEALNETTDNPKVAMDASGNAIVVWDQYDGTYNRIHTNRYDALTDTWEGAVIIDAGANNANDPQVAIDARGNAIVVWQQWGGTAYNIYANRYNFLTGLWGEAVEIDAGAKDAYDPQVVLDLTGNALVVWDQWDGTYNRIYANRYE
jgi:hypothetical protein